MYIIVLGVGFKTKENYQLQAYGILLFKKLLRNCYWVASN